MTRTGTPGGSTFPDLCQCQLHHRALSPPSLSLGAALLPQWGEGRGQPFSAAPRPSLFQSPFFSVMPQPCWPPRAMVPAAVSPAPPPHRSPLAVAAIASPCARSGVTGPWRAPAAPLLAPPRGVAGLWWNRSLPTETLAVPLLPKRGVCTRYAWKNPAS